MSVRLREQVVASLKATSATLAPSPTTPLRVAPSGTWKPYVPQASDNQT